MRRLAKILMPVFHRLPAISLKRLVFCLFTLLCSAELVLRVLGFASPILYEKSDFGYVVKPNQNISFLGNTIRINSHSQRSDEPLAHRIKILILGDSVSFGGNQIDQSMTYPAQLETLMHQRNVGNTQVLNAAAGGWSLFNQAGYIRTFGFSEARCCVWQIGTQDLFQPPASSAMIDSHPAFPSVQPASAITAVVSRYILPRFGFMREASDPGTALDSRPAELEDVLQLVKTVHEMAASTSVNLAILYVPQPENIESQNPEVSRRKLALQQTAQAYIIPFWDLAEGMTNQPWQKFFRDAVHPNALGNSLIAEYLADRIIKSRILDEP